MRKSEKRKAYDRGTGPFAGIKGKGKFNVVGVSPVVNWDDIEWDWETP